MRTLCLAVLCFLLLSTVAEAEELIRCESQNDAMTWQVVGARTPVKLLARLAEHRILRDVRLRGGLVADAKAIVSVPGGTDRSDVFQGLRNHLSDFVLSLPKNVRSLQTGVYFGGLLYIDPSMDNFDLKTQPRIQLNCMMIRSVL